MTMTRPTSAGPSATSPGDGTLLVAPDVLQPLTSATIDATWLLASQHGCSLTKAIDTLHTLSLVSGTSVDDIAVELLAFHEAIAAPANARYTKPQVAHAVRNS
jgi:hypothetical protein